jgi:glycosyltransferase involved in cell wall biosynthesis
VLQVVPRSRDVVDGVGQHAGRLAEALEAAGTESTTVAPEEIPDRGAWDVAHLHYVPFSFPAYGLGAVRVAMRLRRQAPLVITVHEPRIGYQLSPRGTMLAAAQDGVLQLLGRLAAGVIVTTGRWRRFLRGVPSRVVPSGSVLGLAEQPRPTPGRRVPRIGIIPSRHPGRMQHLSEEAARRLGEGGHAEVVAIGAGAVAGLPSSGYLEAPEFAAALARCDLLLLPYLDGVTGRRTSFSSALQLGLPTLTTLVQPMQDFAVDGAFEHTRPDDEEGFLRAAQALAADPGRRAEVARRGRQLFLRELAWPRLADQVAAVYGEVVR